MPLRSDWSGENCPIARSLDVVGDPWVLLILREAMGGARRFDDFRSRLGVADNVLSRRLRGMVEADLLQQSAYQDAGSARVRQEYLLTPAGADLLPLLHQLTLWGEKYRPHPDPVVRMEIVHLSCGEVSATGDTCSTCGAPLTPDTVSWRKHWRDRDFPLVGAGTPVAAPPPAATGTT